MHAHIPHAAQHGLRTWILVAVAVGVLALLAIVWDGQDLGDGLVLGSDASVSSLWERPSSHAVTDDFLFGAPSAERASPASPASPAAIPSRSPRP